MDVHRSRGWPTVYVKELRNTHAHSHAVIRKTRNSIYYHYYYRILLWYTRVCKAKLIRDELGSDGNNNNCGIILIVGHVTSILETRKEQKVFFAVKFQFSINAVIHTYEYGLLSFWMVIFSVRRTSHPCMRCLRGLMTYNIANLCSVLCS